MDGVNLAEPAAAGEFRGEAEIIDVAPLGAGLEHPPVTVHGIRQFLALADGHAARFLAINVLARLGSENGGQRMPMVAGRDQHRIDVLAAEDFEHVPALITILVAVMPVSHSPDDLAPFFLHVGDRHELHVALLEKRAEVLPPARADADAAQKYLSILAGLDYGYRDVAQRLDKLSSLKEKGG